MDLDIGKCGASLCSSTSRLNKLLGTLSLLSALMLKGSSLTKSRLKNEKKNINYLRFDQLRCSLPPMRLTHRLVRGISVSGSIAAIGCVVRDHGEIFRLFVIGHWCGKRLSFSVHFSVCLWLNVALLIDCLVGACLWQRWGRPDRAGDQGL